MKFWLFFYQHWQGFDLSLLVIAMEIRCASCLGIICKLTLLLPSIFVLQTCEMSSHSLSLLGISSLVAVGKLLLKYSIVCFLTFTPGDSSTYRFKHLKQFITTIL